MIWEDLTKALPMLNIGLVHGRMKPQEKQDVMMRFKNAGGFISRDDSNRSGC